LWFLLIVVLLRTVHSPLHRDTNLLANDDRLEDVMAARVSVNPLATDSPTVTARNPSASSPSPHLAGIDEDLAPLGVPALVVAIMLICAGLAAILPLRSWASDYCLVLVIAVYLLYILHMSLAGAMGMWGMRTIRKLHAAKQRQDESKKVSGSR
jgi:hypothetical protein